jgi:GntR family transcriptional regulator
MIDLVPAMKRVDKTTSIPAYYQLKEIIRQKIESHQWKPGAKIPSETQLEKIHHIHRMTVRQGINELCSEGLLYRVRGIGTFVSKQKLERDISNLQSVTLSLRAAGHEIQVKVLALKTISASQNLSEKLEIEKNEKVIQLERLRFLDGVPFYLENSYLPFKLCPDLIHEDLEKASLYFLLEQKYGLSLESGVMKIEAVAADQSKSELLGVRKGFPLLYAEQVVYLDDGQAIQFVETFIRSDQYKYHLARRKKKS